MIFVVCLLRIKAYKFNDFCITEYNSVVLFVKTNLF